MNKTCVISSWISFLTSVDIVGGNGGPRIVPNYSTFGSGIRMKRPRKLSPLDKVLKNLVYLEPKSGKEKN
jgi:hypothetical protein